MISLLKLREFFTLPALAVMLFSVLASLSVGWYFRAQALEAEKEGFAARVDELLEVNRANAEHITELLALREQDLQYYADIAAELNSISGSYGRMRRSLRKLEEDNSDVKTYMSVPVPGDVIRLRRSQREARQNGD